VYFMSFVDGPTYNVVPVVEMTTQRTSRGRYTLPHRRASRSDTSRSSITILYISRMQYHVATASVNRHERLGALRRIVARIIHAPHVDLDRVE
jgi:hypothetical protein